jgi:rhodanese-related sulfurtransferase
MLTFRMKKISLMILAIGLFSNILSSQVPDSAKYCSLQPSEFQKMYLSDKHALLIDVREPFEIKKKMIPGAVNIPSKGGTDAAADTIDKETSLYLYCVSGFRSKRVAISFYDKGFRKLYSLDGGITEWKEKGFPVTRKGKKIASSSR